MKPHNPWTPEETARFLASASARQAQLEARVQLLAKALRDAQEHLLQFIGCRCDSEDVGPGGCSACRHMDEIEALQDALTEAGLYVDDIDVVNKG
jgi:hypothetical protein